MPDERTPTWRTARESVTASRSSRRVLDLGLEDHVEFDDRFLAIDEIADLLAATDVFVTPYRGREQIASGALTFAIAAGCAVVSTPYWYAEDMLASGAGTTRSVRRLRGARRCRLPVHRPARTRSRPRAPRHGGSARSSPGRRWPRRPRTSCAKPSSSRRGDGRSASLDPQLVDRANRSPADAGRRRRHRPARQRRDPEPQQRLLRRRRGAARRRRARARASRRRADLDVDRLPLARVSPRRDRSGRRGMRNFMGYDRRWLDEPHVGDHVGRSVWALGDILSTAWVPAVVGPTATTARRRSSARSRATSRCAPARTPCSDWRGSTRTGLSPPPASCSGGWSTSSPSAYERTRPTDWHWFEDALTYDNARLPHALIVGGAALGREDLSGRPRGAAVAGRRVGPRRRDAAADRAPRPPAGEPAPGGGDEQPLDASAFVEAELAAFAVTGDPEHGMRAQHGVRLVPRPQPAPPAAVRLRDRRLQRRARRGDDERQPGRRVDARRPPLGTPARRGRTAGRPARPDARARPRRDPRASSSSATTPTRS